MDFPGEEIIESSTLSNLQLEFRKQNDALLGIAMSINTCETSEEEIIEVKGDAKLAIRDEI